MLVLYSYTSHPAYLITILKNTFKKGVLLRLFIFGWLVYGYKFIKGTEDEKTRRITDHIRSHDFEDGGIYIMILTVAHTKGGVGKSTLAWNIAHSLKNDGKKVTVVDLDFQQTLFFINQLSDESILDVLQPQSIEELIEIFENYEDNEIIVVDIGGFDSDINRTAMSWADKIIVPISNSVTEVLGFKTFEEILKEIDNPFIYVVLNNIHPLTKNFDVITEAIGDNPNIKLQNTVIRNRKIYKDTLGFGKSVFDTKDEAAKAEIKGLCDELNSN